MIKHATEFYKTLFGKEIRDNMVLDEKKFRRKMRWSLLKIT
jgi:hypothetical protein